MFELFFDFYWHELYLKMSTNSIWKRHKVVWKKTEQTEFPDD